VFEVIKDGKYNSTKKIIQKLKGNQPMKTMPANT